MNIIIVTTENDAMKETGFGTMKACLAMEKSLNKDFVNVSICSCHSEQDLEDVVKQAPDIAILGVKYIEVNSGQKIWLSDYFEAAAINFTGSFKKVLAFDSNKIKAKEMMIKHGVKTADFMTLTPENYLFGDAITLNYPIFLKPLDAANGNGVDDESIVYTHEALKEKSKKLFEEYGPTVVAETFLGGREFTVAVIYSASNNTYIVSPIEVVPPANKDNIRILGSKVKIANSETLICVSDVLIRKKLNDIAIMAFQSLGVRDYGRIDIKMDTDNVCHFVEANLVPGMTEGSSYFPKAIEMDKQIHYGEVIDLMIHNAINRSYSINMVQGNIARTK